MREVFIVGAKGIPSNYGGYETFVDKLTEYHQNNTNLKYHVACKSENSGEYLYHNARCFKIKVPNVGSIQAIYYDIVALIDCCKYIKDHKVENPIIYILACRIGPFAAYFKDKIHKFGGVLYVNPDGHEWKRKKWNFLIKKYWKYSEELMVKYSDLIICDSKSIEKYIHETYERYSPNTTFIAYGAETRKSILTDNDSGLLAWYNKKGLSKKTYYLVVGRFVPENNYEIMIREFMSSKSKRDFVLITNVSEKYLKKLKKKTEFDKDPRIKFVGTVYDQELLMKIRENAYGYLHGHEVGGTNPSLLEALGSTDLNMLLNVGFNKEVGEDGALYWVKKEGNLAELINKADNMTDEELAELALKARKRILNAYSWKFICDEYAKVFSYVSPKNEIQKH